MTAALENYTLTTPADQTPINNYIENELSRTYPPESDRITFDGNRVTQSLLEFGAAKVKTLKMLAGNEDELQEWEQSLRSAQDRDNPNFADLHRNVRSEGTKLKMDPNTQNHGLSVLALAIDFQFSYKRRR